MSVALKPHDKLFIDDLEISEPCSKYPVTTPRR